MTRIVHVSLIVGILFWLAGCKTTQSGPVYLVKIEKGDTLAQLAMKYDTNWKTIARRNGIKNEYDLKVGSIIRIVPGPGGLVAGAKEVTIDLPDRPASSDDEVLEEESGKKGLLFDSAEHKVSWPLKGKISSGFGKRWGRDHDGLDIKASRGTPIRSAAPGRVIFVGRKSGYGKTVIISHRGFKTLYAHCNSILVANGTWVDRGAKIATVGSTGRTTGPHLHFEIRVKEKPINPISWLPGYPNS